MSRIGNIPLGKRPVDESTRIELHRIVEELIRGEDECASLISIRLPEGKIVGNMTLLEFRKGDERTLTIFKGSNTAQLSDVHTIRLSDQSVRILEQHMHEFPPTEEELATAENGNVAGEQRDRAFAWRRRSGQGKGWLVSTFPNTEHPPERIQAAQQQAEAFWSTGSGAKLLAVKNSLPISAYRSHVRSSSLKGALRTLEMLEIIETVAKSQVTIISGETGCGKTTQVPQMLLEDCAAKGRSCRVLCSQPRRISAVSVSTRVAAERGEKLGKVTGYAIRLEKAASDQTALLFVTTGILLKILAEGGTLKGVTHIVLDEVHERDRNSDMALIILRDLLLQRPDLRVVLMSATLDTQVFSKYFGGVETITVPGFTYEVQDYYLDDVLTMVGNPHSKRNDGASKAPATTQKAIISNKEDEQRVHDAIFSALSRNSDEDFDELLDAVCAVTAADGGYPLLDCRHPKTGVTPLMVTAARCRLSHFMALLNLGADASIRANKGKTALDWALVAGEDGAEIVQVLREQLETQEALDATGKATADLTNYHASIDVERVDYVLVEKLLAFLYSDGEFADAAEQGIDGDTLIFLPGWEDISNLMERLEREGSPMASGSYVVLPLHSQISPDEQRRVFQDFKGVHKIILATNIAETAITIDGIVCIINSGRVKEKRFDPYAGVCTLQSTWITTASERQRRGRAGRTRAGIAFHLYSRQRSRELQGNVIPELQRTPLEELCLVARVMDPDVNRSMADFLGKAIEPPVPQAITAGVQLLQEIGAMDSNEQLTTLGRHLARLPLPPTLGKLILYGLLFHCLNPIITVACALGYRSPWVIPLGDGGRKHLKTCKEKFSNDSDACSDHLTLINAFNAWDCSGDGHPQHRFCTSNSLSPATMKMINRMREQIACGFYPMVGPPKLDAAQAKKRNAMVVKTRKAESVSMGPGSSLTSSSASALQFGALQSRSVFVAYEEIIRGDSGSLSSPAATLVPAMPLLLVAARLTTDVVTQAAEEPAGEEADEENQEAQDMETDPPAIVSTVDGWLRFQIESDSVRAALGCLRVRLQAAFQEWCNTGGHSMPDVLQQAITVIREIFTEEGATSSALRGQNNRGRGHGRGRQRDMHKNHQGHVHGRQYHANQPQRQWQHQSAVNQAYGQSNRRQNGTRGGGHAHDHAGHHPQQWQYSNQQPRHQHAGHHQHANADGFGGPQPQHVYFNDQGEPTAHWGAPQHQHVRGGRQGGGGNRGAWRGRRGGHG